MKVFLALTRRLQYSIAYFVTAILVLASAMVGDARHAMSANSEDLGLAGYGPVRSDLAAVECSDCAASTANTLDCAITYAYTHICVAGYFGFAAANLSRALSNNTSLTPPTNDRRSPFSGRGVEPPPPRSA